MRWPTRPTLLLISLCLGAGAPTAPGTWLGQALPGEVAQPFTPSLLAGRSHLGRIAFSPDGLHCAVGTSTADWSGGRLYLSRCVKGVWAPLEAPMFTALFQKTGEPLFSRDGRRLYFTGTLKGSRTGVDLWWVEPRGDGWTAPARLPAPVNSEADEFGPCLGPDGTLYFLSTRAGGYRIFQAKEGPGGTFAVSPVAESLQGEAFPNGDPCVAPDGRFMVFLSMRPGGKGGGDLHVAFADGRGGWTAPRLLESGINTAANEYGPTLSPDGQQLFFVRHTPEKAELWWVSVKAIDRMRPDGAGGAMMEAPCRP